MTNETSHIKPKRVIRGAYSKLNPQFVDIVDFFLSSDEVTSKLPESSLLRSASTGTQFLYYLQKKDLQVLDQVTEDDVVSFFIKNGQPVYETSSRVRLSEFFEVVSKKHPEFTSFRAIKALRSAANFTQEQIADQIGISRQKYARIESGTNNIMQFDYDVKPFTFEDILILRYLLGFVDAQQTVVDFDVVNEASDLNWSLKS